jgi:hypothetical protein
MARYRFDAQDAEQPAEHITGEAFDVCGAQIISAGHLGRIVGKPVDQLAGRVDVDHNRLG